MYQPLSVNVHTFTLDFILNKCSHIIIYSYTLYIYRLLVQPFILQHVSYTYIKRLIQLMSILANENKNSTVRNQKGAKPNSKRIIFLLQYQKHYIALNDSQQERKKTKLVKFIVWRAITINFNFQLSFSMFQCV